jgi:hypothetical protein
MEQSVLQQVGMRLRARWLLSALLALVTMSAARAATRVPLAERSGTERERAHRGAYRKLVRLIDEGARAHEAYGNSYRSRLWARLVNGGERQRTEPDPQAAGRWSSKVRTVYEIDSGVLENVRETLGLHPDLAPRGAEIATQFGGVSTYSRMNELMQSVPEYAPAKTQALVAHEQKLARVERRMIRDLDRTFAARYPLVQAALERLPPADLARHAISLIQELNSNSSDKAIRKDLMGTVHAQGSSQISGNFRGPAGGDRGGFAGSSTYRMDGTFSQLVLDGSTYPVRVKQPSSEPWLLADRLAVDPVRARQLAEIGVELMQVIRALERRQPDLAAPFSTWLNHSRMEFTTGGRYDPHTHVVELSRADADVAARLVPAGVVSKRFAAILQNRPRSLSDHFSNHPLLQP